MQKKLEDFTGRTFGKWKVLYPVLDRHYDGTVYLCQCACGEKRPVAATFLHTGKSTQCKFCRNKQAFEHSQLVRKKAEKYRRLNEHRSAYRRRVERRNQNKVEQIYLS